MSGRRALQTLAAAVTILAATPSRSAAQGDLMREDPYLLSAAVKEAMRSRFYSERVASALLFAGTRVDLNSAAWPATTQVTDGADQMGKVFLITLAATTISDLAGLYLLFCGAYGNDGGCGDRSSLAMAASVPVSILGGAIGAKLAGARHRTVLGSAVGVLPALGVGIAAAKLHESLFFIAMPVVHAGIITIVSR